MSYSRNTRRKAIKRHPEQYKLVNGIYRLVIVKGKGKAAQAAT